MAMFDDPKKELKKLEKQLLQEEEWLDEELEFAKALIGDEPAPSPKKTPPTQRPLEETQIYRAAGTQSAGTPEPQVRNYANGYGKKPARNIYDYDMEQYDDYSDEPVRKPKTKEKQKQKSTKGLLTLACLETLGIVIIVVYWLLFLL